MTSPAGKEVKLLGSVQVRRNQKPYSLQPGKKETFRTRIGEWPKAFKCDTSQGVGIIRLAAGALASKYTYKLPAMSCLNILL